MREYWRSNTCSFAWTRRKLRNLLYRHTPYEASTIIAVHTLYTYTGTRYVCCARDRTLLRTVSGCRKQNSSWVNALFVVLRKPNAAVSIADGTGAWLCTGGCQLTSSYRTVHDTCGIDSSATVNKPIVGLRTALHAWRLRHERSLKPAGEYVGANEWSIYTTIGKKIEN